MNKSIIKSLHVIWLNSPYKYRLNLLFISILSILSGLTEVVTLGSVIPFLSILLDSKEFQNSEIYNLFSIFFSLFNINDFSSVKQVTTLFILLICFSTVLRIILIIYYTHWTYFLGVEIANNIYEKAVNQPYQSYSKHNSSSLLSIISAKLENFTGEVFVSIPQLIVGLTISLFITATIFAITPKIALLTFVIFGLSYFIIHIIHDKKVSLNSINIASKQSLIVKHIQETLGSIKNLILDKSQIITKSHFNNYIFSLRKSQFQNSYIAQYPKFLLEGIAILLIVTIAYLSYQSNNEFSSFIPQLAVLALGGQKLLPLFQMIYNSVNRLKSNSEALHEVSLYLQKPIKKTLLNKKKISFNLSIEISNLYFKYNPKLNYVIKDLNLSVKCGEMIGIYGKSGSGKTTFFDILMGLLLPSKGSIKIDGTFLDNLNTSSWHSMISHVPQNVFLYDDTIKNNIIKNTTDNEFDEKLYIEVLVQSQLNDFINELPNKDNTYVGERGAQLSGGQKQRIGIARALYKNAKILFFDEFTSSLDNETEKNIIDSIEKIDKKEKTIFIISHKLSLLEKCDKRFEFKNCKLNLIN